MRSLMASSMGGKAVSQSLANFDVIVLAAGSSSRFADGNKLVHPYRGSPLLSHLFRAIADLDFGHRIVVTGTPFRADILALLAGHPGWRECFNHTAGSGMGSSIAAGARLLHGADGVFICPGDMPEIRASDFLALARLFAGAQSICRPTFCGQPGHPVLIGRAHYARLRRLDGATGAASLIRQLPDHLITHASSNPGVTLDCDRREHFL